VKVSSLRALAEWLSFCNAFASIWRIRSWVTPNVLPTSLTIAIRSPEDEHAVRRVYQAWQERCPVYLALTKAPGGDDPRNRADLMDALGQSRDGILAEGNA